MLDSAIMNNLIDQIHDYQAKGYRPAYILLGIDLVESVMNPDSPLHPIHTATTEGLVFYGLPVIPDPDYPVRTKVVLAASLSNIHRQKKEKEKAAAAKG